MGDRGPVWPWDAKQGAYLGSRQGAGSSGSRRQVGGGEQGVVESQACVQQASLQETEAWQGQGYAYTDNLMLLKGSQ